MTLEERIKRFMSLMTEATKETGITVAVEHGAPLVVFDLQNQEPINLEITVGTAVEQKNGVTSITTFDKSQIEEYQSKGEKEKMNTEVMFSSKTDAWATPADFYQKLNSEFHFDLDPCADEYNHKCDLYFDKNTNGLLQSWGGHNVFVNPPYGREIGNWVEKAFRTNEEHGNLVVMLLPARTDTKWFHEYIYHKAEIRFIRGRLKFGNSKNAAPFPSMVVIYNQKGI